MAVIYKTLEGVLNPAGRVTLPPDEHPEHPVRRNGHDSGERRRRRTVGSRRLSRPTDRHEDRVERGEIRWR